MEASGGVNLNTVAAIAESGVDFVSRGLRHPLPPPPWTWGWISAWNNTYLSPYHGPVQFQKRYLKGQLHRKDLAENPFEQFQTWFEQALKADIPEPNAFSLATVNAHGRPSLRTVLLKYFDQTGFVFFTSTAATRPMTLKKTRRSA